MAWIKPSKKDMAVTFSYYGSPNHTSHCLLHTWDPGRHIFPQPILTAAAAILRYRGQFYPGFCWMIFDFDAFAVQAAHYSVQKSILKNSARIIFSKSADLHFLGFPKPHQTWLLRPNMVGMLSHTSEGPRTCFGRHVNACIETPRGKCVKTQPRVDHFIHGHGAPLNLGTPFLHQRVHDMFEQLFAT